MEFWLKIKDADNYEVSNYGGFKIRGVISYAEYWHTHRTVSWGLNDKTRKRSGLHRLVFQYFKHEIPPKMVINHKDGDMSNNHIDNLECITQSENIKHAYASGLFITREYKSKNNKNE